MLARATTTNPAVNSKWIIRNTFASSRASPLNTPHTSLPETVPKPTMFARMTALRVVEGLRLPRHPIQHRDPKKRPPPKSLSSAISSGEASWGTAPTPNCSGANMSARPTIARYIEESVSTNMNMESRQGQEFFEDVCGRRDQAILRYLTGGVHRRVRWR
jgi:hypothetical protein